MVTALGLSLWVGWRFEFGFGQMVCFFGVRWLWWVSVVSGICGWVSCLSGCFGLV